MGPKGARPVPYSYNPDLPENWTSVQLKEALKSRGISFPVHARRAVLIRLYTDSVARSHNATGNNEDIPISQNSTDQNSNGDDRQNVLIDIVSKLTSSVQSLQQNVINLTSRVNSMTPGAVPQPITNHLTNRNAQDQARSCTADTISTENYTLDTAFARISSAAAGSADQISEFKRTKYGFSAESLPLVETISPQLRQQITSGKDVNLASLLIPYYIPSDENDAYKKPDKRLLRSLTIGEFIQAFGIYKNIMGQAYPQRRQELDLYERDIIDMATRYPGKGFYEYHRQFSLMAASHLKYNNILVDWSVRNNTLFCNLFANTRAQTCASCNSTLHLSGFCPLNGAVGEKRNGDMDSYGRKRQFHEGKEICNNFNGVRGCQLPRCRNAHLCIECKGDHSKQKCTYAKYVNVPHIAGTITLKRCNRKL